MLACRTNVGRATPVACGWHFAIVRSIQQERRQRPEPGCGQARRCRTVRAARLDEKLRLVTRGATMHYDTGRKVRGRSGPGRISKPSTCELTAPKSCVRMSRSIFARDGADRLDLVQYDSVAKRQAFSGGDSLAIVF